MARSRLTTNNPACPTGCAHQGLVEWCDDGKSIYLTERGVAQAQHNEQEERDAVLYIYGMLTQLKRMGLADGPNELSADGTAAFEQLRKSGYQPSEDAGIGILTSLFGDQAEHVWALIQEVDK